MNLRFRNTIKPTLNETISLDGTGNLLKVEQSIRVVYKKKISQIILLDDGIEMKEVENEHPFLQEVELRTFCGTVVAEGQRLLALMRLSKGLLQKCGRGCGVWVGSRV